MLPEIDYSKISIRTPAWGVTACSKPQIAASNFNSHPRVGGAGDSGLVWASDRISIRTPAWGVTSAHLKAIDEKIISIRTPAWGVTMAGGTYFRYYPFQFAPPRGG